VKKRNSTKQIRSIETPKVPSSLHPISALIRDEVRDWIRTLIVPLMVENYISTQLQSEANRA
jgi:hypothetical protein